MSLGNKIKYYRKNRNLTLTELSKKTGISKSFLSEIENDKSIPSILFIQKISTIFECTIDELVNDKQKTQFNITNDYDDELIECVIYPFAKLNEEGRKEVINFINYQLSKNKKINLQKMITDTVEFSIKND